MEKVLVYPFDDNSIPYVKHQNQFEDIKISSLLSPKGWGLEGRKYNFNEINYIVSSNFQECLEKCTAVLFVDSWLEVNFIKDILKKISLASKKGKKILYMRSSNEDEISMIKKIVPDENLYIIEKENFKDLNNTQEVIYDINTPIVFVAGESENTDKFDLQLSLRGEFISRGYRTSLISSRLESKFFGLHTIPSDMLSNVISEREKIINFNNYIKEIELNENPEIIIIGIPGGALSIGKKIKDYFGVLHYEIGKAVRPDYIFFSLLYNNYTQDYLSNISNEINMILGEKVDLFNITNNKLEFDESNRSGETVFLTLSDDFIDNKISNINLSNLCRAKKDEDIKHIVDKIIYKLSDYANIQTI